MLTLVAGLLPATGAIAAPESPPPAAKPAVDRSVKPDSEKLPSPDRRGLRKDSLAEALKRPVNPSTRQPKESTRWSVMDSAGQPVQTSKARKSDDPALRTAAAELAATATANAAPVLVSPVDNAVVTKLTPTLKASISNPDSGSVYQYRFTVCAHHHSGSGSCSDDNYNSEPAVADSGWISKASYVIPTGRLRWNASFEWSVEIRDNPYMGTIFNPVATFHVVVPVLSGAHTGRDPFATYVQGVNLGTGNLLQSATDASVPSLGAQLTVTRMYTSDDTRVGAFGTGWSSVLDMKVTPPSGSTGPIVRLADGHEEAFGINPDGTYAPAPGNTLKNLTKCGTCTTYLATDGTGTVYELNTTALVAVTDPAGRKTTVTRDATTGKVTALTDAISGRKLSFTWSGSIVTSVTATPAPTGQSTTWTYTYSSNRLTKACDPRGAAYCTTYGYTDATFTTKITTVTGARGKLQQKITYASSGLVASVADAYTKTWTFARTAITGGTRVTVTNPRSYVATYDMDSYGRVTKLTDAGAGVQTWTYATTGQLARYVNGNGSAVELTYDDDGHLTSRKTWRDATTSTTQKFTYVAGTGKAAGRLEAAQDPRNTYDNLFRLGYDTNGRLISRTDGTYPAAVTRYAYTAGTETAIDGGSMPASLLRTLTDPVGAVTTYSYDTKGDLRQIVDPVGLRTVYEYDALGRQAASTVYSDSHPAGVRTEYTYDPASRLATVTQPEITDPLTGTRRRLRTTQGYDADGNHTSETLTDLVSSTSRSQSFTYDDAGRLLTTTGPDGTLLQQLTYDANGNIATSTDATGAVLRYTYSKLDHQASVTAVGYTDPANPATPRDITLESRTYDKGGRLATSTDATGQVSQYAYYADDLLKSITAVNAPKGDGTTGDIVLEAHEYDAVGNVTATDWNDGRTRAVGTYNSLNQLASTQIAVPAVDTAPGHTRTLNYSYDLDGRLTRDSLSGGGFTGYEYDAAGRLITVNEPGAWFTDAQTRLTRDQLGQVIRVTGPLGSARDDAAHTTSYSYDEAGNLTEMLAPPVETVTATGTQTLKPSTRYGYDAFGRQYVDEAPTGERTTRTFDVYDRLTQVTAPTHQPPGGATMTPVRRYGYDEMGRIVSQTDPTGHSTTTEYDTLGRQVRRTLPALASGGPPRVSTARYDDAGRLVKITDPTGAVGEFAWDKLGRKTSETTWLRGDSSSTPLTTQYTYDVAGNLTAVADPAGGRSTAVYNALGEAVRSTDADGVSLTYAYDMAGNVTRTTDALGRSTVYEYDTRNRLVKRSDNDAENTTLQTASWTYDMANNMLTASLPGQGTETRTYDALNRLVTTGRGYDTAATLGYDLSSRTVSYIDPLGHETQTTYTPWDQVATVVEPATTAHPDATDRTWSYTYDIRGLPTSEVHPGGVRVDRTFDQGGNVLTETGSGGGAPTTTRQFNYDLNGRLTQVSHPDGWQDLGYDDRGLLTGSSGPEGTSSFAYDAAGRPTSRTDAIGTTASTWTPAGRLATVTEPGAGVTTLRYDTVGQLTTEERVNGTERRYTYDGIGRMTSDKLVNLLDTELYSTAYEYNAYGEIAKRTIGPAEAAGAGTTSYGYSTYTGRLSTWTGPDNVYHFVNWDVAGNLVADAGTTRTYDERNRLLSDGTSTYTYTPRGTLESRQSASDTISYQHDAFDRLTSDGDTTFTYDGFDRLATAGTTAFGYAGTDQDPVTAGTRSWVHSPSGQLLGADGRPVLTNAHGDVVAGLDNGEVDASRYYGPFGTPQSTGTDLGAAGYQGDWTATSGLVHMGARWYDPSTRQFTARDDIALDVGDQNRYAYGAGDPINNNDPTGHLVQCATPVTAPVCVGAAVGSSAGPLGTVLGGTAGLAIGGGILACMHFCSGSAGSGSTSSTASPGINAVPDYVPPPVVVATPQVPAININLDLGSLSGTGMGGVSIANGGMGAAIGAMTSIAGIQLSAAGIQLSIAGAQQVNVGIREVNTGIREVNTGIRNVNTGIRSTNRAVHRMNTALDQINAALDSINTALVNLDLPTMNPGPPPVLGEPPIGTAAPDAADICGSGYRAGCGAVARATDNTCATAYVRMLRACTPTLEVPRPGSLIDQVVLDGPTLADGFDGGASEPPTTTDPADPCRDSDGGGSADDPVAQEGRTEKHHSWPKYMGPPTRQRLVPLTQSEHRDLHQSMNDFLDNCTPIDGTTMRPKSGWSGKLIRQQYSQGQRALALARFYKGPGSRFTSTADAFFDQFSHYIPPMF